MTSSASRLQIWLRRWVLGLSYVPEPERGRNHEDKNAMHGEVPNAKPHVNLALPRQRSYAVSLSIPHFRASCDERQTIIPRRRHDQKTGSSCWPNQAVGQPACVFRRTPVAYYIAHARRRVSASAFGPALVPRLPFSVPVTKHSVRPARMLHSWRRPQGRKGGDDLHASWRDKEDGRKRRGGGGVGWK